MRASAVFLAVAGSCATPSRGPATSAPRASAADGPTVPLPFALLPSGANGTAAQDEEEDEDLEEQCAIRRAARRSVRSVDVLARCGSKGHPPSTSGRVVGLAVAQATGDPVFEATVVIESAALPGPMAEITDEAGCFVLDDLPPGAYELSFYDGDILRTRARVQVGGGRTSPVHVAFNTGVPTRDPCDRYHWQRPPRPLDAPGDFGPPRGMPPERNPWRPLPQERPPPGSW